MNKTEPQEKPQSTVTLNLEATFNLNGEDPRAVCANARKAIGILVAKGDLAGDTKAEVVEYQADAIVDLELYREAFRDLLKGNITRIITDTQSVPEQLHEALTTEIVKAAIEHPINLIRANEHRINTFIKLKTEM